MIITLDELPVGKQGVVKKVNVNNELKIRLLDLGLINGTKIKKTYKSPLNDPCAYQVRDSIISLRNVDTKNILVYYKKENYNGVN